jgi:hypothetical protein
VIRSGRPPRLDPRNRFGREVLARDLEIVVRLEVQPEFRAVAKIQAEAQRCISGGPPTVMNDLGNPVRLNTDRLRELILRQAASPQKFLLQHLAGRDRRRAKQVIATTPLNKE